MSVDIYRYTFGEAVPDDEIETTLLLAVVAAEALHGESRVLLNCRHLLDPDSRRCVIDARTSVGDDLNQLFVGLLVRQFGPDAFRIERLDRNSPERVSA